MLLTHGHRDASGGMAALNRWAATRTAPLRVYAHPSTIEVVRGRLRRLDALQLRPFLSGQRARISRWTVSACLVPHARDPRFPTFAWRLAGDGARLVYVSDVAQLTADLRSFCRGADLLVLDGALVHRTLHSHLTIERAVPEVCQWAVDQIWLTQIGRSAPPHAELEQLVHQLCPRARPAYDGLTVPLDAQIVGRSRSHQRRSDEPASQQPLRQ